MIMIEGKLHVSIAVAEAIRKQYGRLPEQFVELTGHFTGKDDECKIDNKSIEELMYRKVVAQWVTQ